MYIDNKSSAQITAMREGGKIHAEIMQRLQEITKPGKSTYELDLFAEKLMRKYRVRPSFKGYHGFPKSICTNLNEEVVHGIPSKRRVLRSGDVVKLDMGIYHCGLHTDAGVTVMVGKVSEKAKKLSLVTKECLHRAIALIQPGIRIQQLGKAIAEHAENHGFYVVKTLTGHGIGRQLHEPPEVPNFYRPQDTTVLTPGMTLAIEPMVNIGTSDVREQPDGWTIVTADTSLSAYWEHTVVVTQHGAEILTKLG